MPEAMIPANRLMSGTWGQVWVDNELWADLSAAQAKISYNKSAVNICGAMAEDSKVTSVKGTGSITVAKVYTRNINRADSLMEGHDVRATIVMKLADPDAYGAERIALYNVSFDDETLADFRAGNPVKVSYPFTFTGWDYLDTISPR